MSTPPPGSTRDDVAAKKSAFWSFSLALYGKAGVPEACLRLQDECGVDVNVLFFTLFLARSGRCIDAADLARIESVAGAWRCEVVQPLRAVRRWLKSPAEPYRDDAVAALRAEIKRIELEAERLQQLALERECPANGLGRIEADDRRAASHNLGIYAERLGGFPNEAVDLLLRRLYDI